MIGHSRGCIQSSIQQFKHHPIYVIYLAINYELYMIRFVPGRVADTWGTFLLPADIPSPAAVSKYGRGIQNETTGVSHVITGVNEFQ